MTEHVRDQFNPNYSVYEKEMYSKMLFDMIGALHNSNYVLRQNFAIINLVPKLDGGSL